MKKCDQETIDAMGEFHNTVVGLVDTSTLSLPELIVVLRVLANELEDAFTNTVKG
jgi:hypothetical protein